MGDKKGIGYIFIFDARNDKDLDVIEDTFSLETHDYAKMDREKIQFDKDYVAVETICNEDACEVDYYLLGRTVLGAFANAARREGSNERKFFLEPMAVTEQNVLKAIAIAKGEMDRAYSPNKELVYESRKDRNRKSDTFHVQRYSMLTEGRAVYDCFIFQTMKDMNAKDVVEKITDVLDDKEIRYWYNVRPDNKYVVVIFINGGYYITSRDRVATCKEKWNALDEVLSPTDTDVSKVIQYSSGIAPNYGKREVAYENAAETEDSVGDIENLEYRKGSKEFGGLVTRLVEFLRLHRESDQDEVVMKTDDFEEQSKITVDELRRLIEAKRQGKPIYDFEIVINGNTVAFIGLNMNGKNRPFESNVAIRDEYKVMGVEDFYKEKGNTYKNPHFADIKDAIIRLDMMGIVDLSKTLDLGAGTGEVIRILEGLGYRNVEGSDPYLYDECERRTGKKCMRYSFEDIMLGALSDKRYSTVIASYSLHLAKKSILHDLFWQLSLVSDGLVIISPNNRPEVSEDSWEQVYAYREGKAKVRIYRSKNKNIR